MNMKRRSTSLRLSRKTATAIIEKENAVKKYLNQPYSRVIIPELDGKFSAELLEFSGCIAQGNTPDEAFDNLEHAAYSWILASLRAGKEIPPPAVNYGYSGKFV